MASPRTPRSNWGIQPQEPEISRDELFRNARVSPHHTRRLITPQNISRFIHHSPIAFGSKTTPPIKPLSAFASPRNSGSEIPRDPEKRPKTTPTAVQLPQIDSSRKLERNQDSNEPKKKTDDRLNSNPIEKKGSRNEGQDTTEPQRLLIQQIERRMERLKQLREITPMPEDVQYLLRYYMAFDELTTSKGKAILEKILENWKKDSLQQPDIYCSQNAICDVWTKVHEYCESSILMPKITSRIIDFPNPLATAICCEFIDKVCSGLPELGEMLQITRSVLFSSVYMDFEPGAWFLKMTPHYVAGRRKTQDYLKKRIESGDFACIGNMFASLTPQQWCKFFLEVCRAAQPNKIQNNGSNESEEEDENEDEDEEFDVPEEVIAQSSIMILGLDTTIQHFTQNPRKNIDKVEMIPIEHPGAGIERRMYRMKQLTSITEHGNFSSPTNEKSNLWYKIMNELPSSVKQRLIAAIFALPEKRESKWGTSQIQSRPRAGLVRQDSLSRAQIPLSVGLEKLVEMIDPEMAERLVRCLIEKYPSSSYSMLVVKRRQAHDHVNMLRKLSVRSTSSYSTRLNQSNSVLSLLGDENLGPTFNKQQSQLDENDQDEITPDMILDILNTEGPDLLGSVLMMEPNILLNAIVERPSLMRVLLDAVNSMNEQATETKHETKFETKFETKLILYQRILNLGGALRKFSQAIVSDAITSGSVLTELEESARMVPRTEIETRLSQRCIKFGEMLIVSQQRVEDLERVIERVAVAIQAIADHNQKGSIVIVPGSGFSGKSILTHDNQGVSGVSPIVQLNDPITQEGCDEKDDVNWTVATQHLASDIAGLSIYHHINRIKDCTALVSQITGKTEGDTLLENLNEKLNYLIESETCSQKKNSETLRVALESSQHHMTTQEISQELKRTEIAMHHAEHRIQALKTTLGNFPSDIVAQMEQEKLKEHARRIKDLAMRILEEETNQPCETGDMIPCDQLVVCPNCGEQFQVSQSAKEQKEEEQNVQEENFDEPRVKITQIMSDRPNFTESPQIPKCFRSLFSSSKTTLGDKTLPKRVLSKTISQIYTDKFTRESGISARNRMTLPRCVYKFYMQRYGLRKLAEDQLLKLLNSLHKLPVDLMIIEDKDNENVESRADSPNPRASSFGSASEIEEQLTIPFDLVGTPLLAYNFARFLGFFQELPMHVFHVYTDTYEWLQAKGNPINVNVGVFGVGSSLMEKIKERADPNCAWSDEDQTQAIPLSRAVACMHELFPTGTEGEWSHLLKKATAVLESRAIHLSRASLMGSSRNRPTPPISGGNISSVAHTDGSSSRYVDREVCLAVAVEQHLHRVKAASAILSALFTAGDINDDGELTFDEYYAMIKYAEPTLEDWEIDEMFDETLQRADKGSKNISDEGDVKEKKKKKKLKTESKNENQDNYGNAGITREDFVTVCIEHSIMMHYRLRGSNLLRKRANNTPVHSASVAVITPEANVVRDAMNASDKVEMLQEAWQDSEAEVRQFLSSLPMDSPSRIGLLRHVEHLTRMSTSAKKNPEDAEAAWMCYRIIMAGVRRQGGLEDDVGFENIGKKPTHKGESDGREDSKEDNTKNESGSSFLARMRWAQVMRLHSHVQNAKRKQAGLNQTEPRKTFMSKKDAVKVMLQLSSTKTRKIDTLSNSFESDEAKVPETPSGGVLSSFHKTLYELVEVEKDVRRASLSK